MHIFPKIENQLSAERFKSNENDNSIDIKKIKDYTMYCFVAVILKYVGNILINII